MRGLRLIMLAVASSLFASAARGADIIGGPMVGAVTDRSARVWVELSVAKQVTVSAFTPEGRSPVSRVSVDVEGPTPFVADVPLNNLAPNQTYRIELALDGETVTPPPPALSVRTMPSPGEEAAVTVALGAGLDPAAGVTGSMFKQITSVGPRAFFFLGDDGYLPGNVAGFPQTRRAAFRFISDFHSRIRREPALQTLLRNTPVFAVWNDHDFGPDDANKSFVYAPESLAAFQHFFPNPDWGTPQVPGCFFTTTIGDADFFCLDDRMYRDPPAASGTGASSGRSMFGAGQLDWLKAGLAASKATFKIIASGDELLGGENSAESWGAFQPEQRDFIAWLFKNHITGVVFVSGGRNFGELTGRKPAGAGEYPLLNLSIGALSAAPAAVAPAEAGRIGDAVVQNTFGTLEFGGQRNNRFITLRLRDASGKIRLEQTVLAAQLR